MPAIVAPEQTPVTDPFAAAEAYLAGLRDFARLPGFTEKTRRLLSFSVASLAAQVGTARAEAPRAVTGRR